MFANSTAQRSTDWQHMANCRGEAGRDFYPPFDGEHKRLRIAREAKAKAVCQACPVKLPCLEQAIASGERYGVWGGLTSDERVTLRRSA